MRLVLMIMSLFVYCAVTGQYKGPRFPINDQWFWKYGSKGLQEGDRMPDIPLGTVINNKTGKKRFGEFKGKLLILDFWNTYCSSCIEGFPKMEKLQKEFGDKIQIILVNTRENETQIHERAKTLKGFKLPDFPSIVADRPFLNPEEERLHPHPLAKLFPTIGVPHHVWIDTKGIIRLIGGSENTYPDKIRDFLDGKAIQFLKNTSTVPSLNGDPDSRYYQQLGFFKKTPLRYGSFITPYTNEIVGSYGAKYDVVDSTAKTRISYMINEDLLSLYLNAFYKAFGFGKDSFRDSVLYRPSGILDFVIFPSGIDTIDFTSNSTAFNRYLTTEEIIQSKYCYEQILPWEVNEQDRGQFMIEDLNRYFSIRYGVVAALEKKSIPYYALVRTSEEDKAGSQSSGNSNSPTDTRVFNGIKAKVYNNWALGSVLSDLILHNPHLGHQLTENKKKGYAFLLVNKTGWSAGKSVTLQLPIGSVSTIADLQNALSKYDLGIVEDTRTVMFLTFKTSTN